MDRKERLDRDIEIEDILNEFSAKRPPDRSAGFSRRVSDETLDNLLAEVLVKKPAKDAAQKPDENPTEEQPAPKNEKRAAESDDPLKIDETLVESIPTWEERHSKEYLEKNPDDPIHKIKKMSGVKASEAFLSSLKKQGGIQKEKTDVIYSKKEASEDNEPTRVIPVQKAAAENHNLPAGQIMLDGFAEADSAATGVWDVASPSCAQKAADSVTISFEEDGEYHTAADVPAVMADLGYRRNLLTGQVIATFLIELVLCLLTFSQQLGPWLRIFDDNPGFYLMINAAAAGLAVLINCNTVFGGLIKVFRGRITADTAAAIVTLTCLAHNVVLLFFYERYLGSLYQNLYNSAAVFCLLVIVWGKRMSFSTRISNFDLIANEELKHPIEAFYRTEEALELGRGLSVGDRKVCASRTSRHVSDFIYHSFAVDPCDLAGRWLLLLSVVFALLGGALCYFWPGKGEVGNWLDAFSALCGTLCVTLPFMATVSGGGILKKTCKGLSRQGIMLSGFDAVENFRDTDIIALDAGDLFPVGSVTLKGIKTVSNRALDRSIMDVAGIINMSGGPLKPLFAKILQNNSALLPDVDTIVYEEEMGISGWVSGRRVLVGNRRLLEYHGVDVPELGYETSYEGTGIKPVYLSAGGELSAVFLVQYRPDTKIGERLRETVKKGIAISVYSCDPNVTSKLVCDLYRLPIGSVRVMGTAARHVYNKLSKESREPLDGMLLCTGKADSILGAVLTCRRTGKLLSFARVLEILACLIGAVLALGLVYTSGASGISTAVILLFQLIGLLIVRGLPAIGI